MARKDPARSSRSRQTSPPSHSSMGWEPISHSVSQPTLRRSMDHIRVLIREPLASQLVNAQRSAQHNPLVYQDWQERQRSMSSLYYYYIQSSAALAHSSSSRLSGFSMIPHFSSCMSSSSGSSAFQALISHSVRFLANPLSYTTGILSIVHTIRRCDAFSWRRYSVTLTNASLVLLRRTLFNETNRYIPGHLVLSCTFVWMLSISATTD
jgi:hypothetical protein